MPGLPVVIFSCTSLCLHCEDGSCCLWRLIETTLGRGAMVDSVQSSTEAPSFLMDSLTL